MVHTKGGQCEHCCCADCSPLLPAETRPCCPLCVCDELCVEISMDAGTHDPPCDISCECDVNVDCSCVRGRSLLTYDEASCAWTGTARCGEVAVDLEVRLHSCSDDTCYMCITSTCLSMAGDCDTKTDCVTVSDGGQYTHNCNITDGFTSISISKDVSGCNEVDCGTADITIKCTNFTNPNDPTKICENCDCVCECICITYTEGSCSEIQKACWDSGNQKWSATFDDDCAFASQTIDIELIADGSCCQWRLSSSRGTVDTPEVNTSCPTIDETWTIDDIGATVEVECSICDVCVVDNLCCNRDLPDTLYARICGPCGSWCVAMPFVGSTATTAAWKSSTVTVQCTDTFDFACYDTDIEIEFECLSSGTLWQINVHCGGTLIHSDGAVTVDCDPLCAHTAFTGLGGNAAACNYQGPVLCIDPFDVCISEVPC